MDISKELEALRSKLNEIVRDGTLCNNSILEISRQVDEIILKFYAEESKDKKKDCG